MWFTNITIIHKSFNPHEAKYFDTRRVHPVFSDLFAAGTSVHQIGFDYFLNWDLELSFHPDENIAVS
jgi:hypothetical protein